MACMCGDYCCWSCGPAQGNWKCPICGEWASEVCEHINDEGNDVKPEYKAEAERLARLEREAEEAMAKYYEESKKYAEEFRRTRRQ